MIRDDGDSYYGQRAGATVRQYGGRYLVRGGGTEVAEGDWNVGCLTIIEFPSLDEAHRWSESPEYGRVRARRHGDAESQFTFVEGLRGQTRPRHDDLIVCVDTGRPSSGFSRDLWRSTCPRGRMPSMPSQRRAHAASIGPRRRAPVQLRSAGAAMALWIADAGKWCAVRSYPLFELGATTPIPRWIEPLGARGAFRAALHAYRRVPAYRDFVDASGWVDDQPIECRLRAAMSGLQQRGGWRESPPPYPTRHGP